MRMLLFIVFMEKAFFGDLRMENQAYLVFIFAKYMALLKPAPFFIVGSTECHTLIDIYSSLS